MTKSDLVEAVGRRMGFSRKRCANVVDLILEIMKERFERGEQVKLSGFGSFEVREKVPRRGRNPQTGEKIILPARRVLTFRASQLLRARLNGRQARTTGD